MNSPLLYPFVPLIVSWHVSWPVFLIHLVIFFVTLYVAEHMFDLGWNDLAGYTNADTQHLETADIYFRFALSLLVVLLYVAFPWLVSSF